MRTALIGHRGTGKTSLLHRIEAAYWGTGRKVECHDLDFEVERSAGRTIAAVFRDEGEEAFRRLERSCFSQIDDATGSAKHDIFVALGAGFDPSLIPSSWRVVWVKRPSDEKGRIFFNRPALNAGQANLADFHERYHRRLTAYRERATETIILDEGLEGPDEAEKCWILDDLRNLNASLTLGPDDFSCAKTLSAWIERRLRWGIRYFELRDDLLSEEQLDLALRHLPDDRALLSFRDPAREESSEALLRRQGLAFDWPIERGECTLGEPTFLSLHERREGESLQEALHRFPRDLAPGTVLKAALPVHDFKELALGHAWREALPESRVFLPMSEDGRWAWYRLLQGSKLPLNFVREGDGSAKDQPTLLQWARRRITENTATHLLTHSTSHAAYQVSSQVTSPSRARHEPTFAALLGDPAMHSRTPIEQRDFFAKSGVPVFSIRVKEEEWLSQSALEILRGLGLRWAAVTSPLKRYAYEASRTRDRLAEDLGAVNTLRWDTSRDGWDGANTDVEGLLRAVDLIRHQDGEIGTAAVWGGGGTLGVVRQVLPEVVAFSARTGEVRDINDALSGFNPDTIVWATSGARSGQVTHRDPPEHWRPKRVIDLSYGEDSPGRAYALRTGAKYHSGLAMFRAQADAQRRFWESS